jgi:hypothetical protein
MDILLSINWTQQSGEPDEVYTARMVAQKSALHDMILHKGNCYMVKFGEDDIRPMWENQIDSEVLRKQVPSPLTMPLDCPLCQPYDHFDITANNYDTRRYLTKIINPKYPEGFIDKGGVWTKCPCQIKGEARKYLKFLRTSSTPR